MSNKSIEMDAQERPCAPRTRLSCATHVQLCMARMRRTILLLATSLTLNAYGQSPTTIPYDSPRAAYVALSKDPGAKLKSNAEGWEIVHVTEGPNEGVWTFAPNSHPSFPSVVRRQILEQDGQMFVGMRILCGGAKAACDQYVAEFKELNEQMAKELNQRRAGNKSTR
jgi:hypothetical protein